MKSLPASEADFVLSYTQKTFLGPSWVKVWTVYYYLGLWLVKIRTMSAVYLKVDWMCLYKRVK